MKSVFIIHGHDSDLLKEAVQYVRNLNLNAIVLKDQDDLGMTIIEKFEYYASTCIFAIALLTPDDKQWDELPESERFRARQNVIYELGWFCGRAGRSKTVLIHKGAVEIPSDLSGVLYMPVRKSFFEIADGLKQRLRGQNVIL